MRYFRIIPILTSFYFVGCSSENTDQSENGTNRLNNHANYSYVKRIAHAGGGIHGEAYTNSYEALNYNLNQGFELFEIDLSWTSDQQLVCIHDWDSSYQKLFGIHFKRLIGTFFQKLFDINFNETPTLLEFKRLSEDSRYRPCTLNGLAKWLSINKKTMLVTDIKRDNINALKLIIKEIVDYKTRVIVQIYHPKEYKMVRSLGYENIIWTLYRTAISNDKVLKTVDNMELFAVTMPIKRAENKLAMALKEKNIPTYVHTVNSTRDLEYYKNMLGVTEIYTDYLSPKQANHDE